MCPHPQATPDDSVGARKRRVSTAVRRRRALFGVNFPLTGERESTPAIGDEPRLARHAESVDFAGLWARDVPTFWPRFGDAGGAFDA